MRCPWAAGINIAASLSIPLLALFQALWLVDTDPSGYIGLPLIGRKRGALRPPAQSKYPSGFIMYKCKAAGINSCVTVRSKVLCIGWNKQWYECSKQNACSMLNEKLGYFCHFPMALHECKCTEFGILGFQLKRKLCPPFWKVVLGFWNFGYDFWEAELQKIILCLGTCCFVKLCLLTSEVIKSSVSYLNDFNAFWIVFLHNVHQNWKCFESYPF
jgi:hypothetical protein